jgi:hypothetical protein
MLRDVFYYGDKPNVHPREQLAENLADARLKAITRDFWIINEFCDYRNFDWDFDFEFLPDEDVWAEDHNNVWPSQHQKDSGTWLCPKEHSDLIIYRNDVDPVIRKNEKNDNWVEIELVDSTKFDFSWHPDPTDPPYIYKWPCKFFPAEFKHVLEYRVPGATQEKYMNTIAELLPEYDRWVEHQEVDKSRFDMSWRPNPLDPPFIYVWGNKYIDGKLKPTLEYHVPGATNKKYMSDLLKVLPEWDKWVEVQSVDKSKFDFTWRPDPREPAYVYVWGNKYIDAELRPTLEYHCEGATERKYVTNDVAVLPEWDKWVEVQPINKSTFDFSWRPDPREPDLIYVFGNELFDAVKMPTVEYRMDGAIDRKYIEGSTAKLLPNPKLFEHLEDAVLPSYAWLPDPDSPPYIYVWGNQWNEAADKASVQFVVAGATEYKYMTERAIKKPCMDNWIIPEGVDCTGFDFSREPSPAAPPYNYEFGTQWQKTGGPIYAVEGATEKTYVDFQKVKRNVIDDNWHVPDNIDPKVFDFTWHPDATDPAYDYVFATQWAFSGGPVYKMEGATGIKYVEDQIAKATANMDNWAFDADLIDVDSFDWSWHPYIEDVPYIYEFGTQHQKTGGPKYITPGADSSSPVKYIDTRILKSKRLPNKDAKWHVVNDYRINNFDYSWHPDATEEPYIYVFGNNQYPAEEMPTIEYRMPGATTIKYVPEMLATLEADLRNWQIPEYIDTEDFDFSWHPNPNDPPYVYEFGTQWQKTGGPRYVVADATETKYIDTQKVKKTSIDDCWHVPDNIDPEGFDFTWHPDATDPAYDYVFATQWAFSGGPIYKMENATGIKYVEDQTAKAIASMENWVFDPDLIEIESFDWSWHPYVEDQPYVYEFGTQWQKTGGPKYITPGADSSSPTKYIDTRILKATKLPHKDARWHVINDYRIKSFDYSWHPDNTEEPFIYVFGNNQYPAEEMSTIEYRVPGATKTKYVSSVVAVLEADLRNWQIPEYIDTEDFDFSWHPNPNDPPYIYEFGTQWQKTGGPVYIVKGATETKYVDTQSVTKTSVDGNWEVPSYIDNDSFDFTWHPDATSPAYNYVFPTQWAFSGGPVYRVEGATEIKYVEEQTAKALPDRENWEFDPKIIDESSIDFSWHPYADDQPYIYEFGTQWQPNGGPRYVTSGATENSPVKYVDIRIMQTTRLPSTAYWNTLTEHPIESFDYSWHPDNTEEPYVHVFGNTQYPAEEMPTIEYRVSGAETIKYEHTVVAKLGPSMTNWEVSKHLDVSNFDFSWIPHPDDPAFIYEFGTQWQKTGGPRYIVPNATQVKYVDTRVQHARRLPNRKNWNVLVEQAIDDFDYSWHPDDTEEPFIYVFGNTQYPAEEMPTIEYRVASATSIKYVHDTVAKLAPSVENWEIPDNIDVNLFDFSWVPHPDDPAFIYQFGTQWQKTGGPKYIVLGATQTKYVDTRVQRAVRLSEPSNFKTLHGYKIKDFDYSWHPDETAPPYIYQFGNNLYPVDECPTIEYIVEGATEISLVTDVIAKLGVNKTNWKIPEGVEVKKFDFTWVPHPLAPPYIYQFGTKLDNNDGPSYISPDNDGEIVYLPRIEVEDIEESEEIVIGQYYIETTLDDLVAQHPNEIFWATRKNIDYSTFDFDWRPGTVEVAWELDYVHVFGSPESELTQTYFISAKHYAEGKTSLKFVEELKLDESTLSKIFTKPDMFFVDRSNPESAARFEALRAKYGTRIQKTRYLNSWVDTVNRCINRSTTELLWVLNSELDYSDFNFEYYPNPWQMKMVQVFGTQWSHWGTTFMVNRETFAEDTKYIKIIEHLSNLNFVKDIKATATQCVHDIVVIDHGNKELTRIVEQLKKKAPNKNVTTVKYNQTYFDTLKDIISKQQEKKEHYIWICSSVCDYADFDLSYVCDPFARDQLHVFPSGKQKFGDTFFVDVNKTKEIISEMQVLDDYHKVNYNGTLKATRLPEPTIVIGDDTHVDAVKLVDSFPYATLITSDNVNLDAIDIEPMSLWTPETKNIIVTSTGATRIVVPKEAMDHVKNELYDYPYIKRAPKLMLSSPLDIVFLSNGEAGAEENWEHLLSATKGIKNRIVRVDGVNGRVAAYHAAAEASNTPWMFTVFAKLKISPKFDWNWQPDRMQAPKHYIFHAKNLVNGLTYGHQAMIAYNKKLALANEGRGLDFTLDNLHETVPLVSGTAQYNTDEFSTWRTAFREVLKLRADDTDIAKERLNAWLNKASGDFAQYSIKGALDADEYYDEVDGDFDKLRLSYEWAWLREKFDQI